MDLNLVGPIIYSEEGPLHETVLIIQDTKITGLKKQTSTSSETIEFPENYHIVPGFIDLHVHGGSGYDVMDATTDSLHHISQTLLAEGTTSFLATTMTAEINKIEECLKNICEFKIKKDSKDANILGVHLEGPFIASSKTGAQDGKYILSPDLELFKRWQAISNNEIRMVTLAPEHIGSEAFIKYLVKHNVVASVGHTNATYLETQAAITYGCTHATHLFNAMRGIHQREPGVITAALLSNQMTVEIIVDGVHLHPAIVSLVRKTKGEEKIILVTDSMRAKCMSDGCYDLGGQKVNVENGEARLTNGALAGSTLKMSSAIKNMMSYTGCNLEAAIMMASSNPAKVLGIFDKKGSIAIGKDADLVVLDDKLHVVMTICDGQVVYKK